MVNPIEDTTVIYLEKTIYIFLISLAIAIFLKNAWVTEDAYIIFRSIEQLFAGNGPVWNPHERVQVYTSPLWYFVLAFARVFSSNVFLNAIIVSLILWLLVTLILTRILRDNLTFLIAILLLSSSTAFFDFTSSGLENVLAYLIIVLYIFYYVRLFTFTYLPKDHSIRIILFLFGLIILVRHDLMLLLLPSTVYVVWEHLNVFSKKLWIKQFIIALSPFILFSLFSLLYYGFPFPNTAYAKLNTGIERIEILKQGIAYFYASFKYDFITLIIICGAVILLLCNITNKFYNPLGGGIVLNLLYILYVGGDFMQGRFLSYAYLTSVILLLATFRKIYSLKILIFIVISCYCVFYPHTPFNSPYDYSNDKIEMGIADERGYYFHITSLYSYIFNKTARFSPENINDITIKSNIGIFGYSSGIKRTIVDPLALSDPLLARMPVTGWWRIGHFQRSIPEGYIESLTHGKAVIVDPQINEFYKKLKIITQSEQLFTLERLKTIVLFNLGYYNHLLH